ncbi:MAG: hypothetical protein SNH45_05965 [Rikenellaceae bacterium]
MISVIGFGGCIASHQSVVRDINVDNWSETTSIMVSNYDTVTVRDLDIFVRYQPTQSPRRFDIRVESIAPDSTSYTDEVTISLDTSTNNRDASRLTIQPYRTRVVWRQKGEYKINITPTTPTKGVEAIGLNTK